MQANELIDYGKKKNQTKFSISMITSAIIMVLLMQFVFELDHVSGRSMYPTLEDGEYVFCIKNTIRHYKPDDIVNIKSVVLGTNIVKRVIGTGGDHIEITEDGTFYKNGERLKEPYINKNDNSDIEPMDVDVPNGYLFVMGDNRGESADSRMIGCISESEVVSVVLFSFK